VSANAADHLYGSVVLEILNHSPDIIALTPEMPMDQLIFEKLSMLPHKAYGGRYHGQVQP